MKPLPDWKKIILTAWSMWGIYAMILLTAADSILRELELGLDPLTYQIAMAALAALTGIARILDQNLAVFIRDESGAMRKRAVGAVAGSGIALMTAVAFIGQWEGLRTEAYRDVVGVWTVCYGETKGVRPGDSYTKAECDKQLIREIASYEAQLDKCLTAKVPIGMKVALISWAYNVGPGAACRSTLVRKANAGDLVGACHELSRWNRAGGRVIRGLTNRRISERAMCLEAIRDA